MEVGFSSSVYCKGWETMTYPGNKKPTVTQSLSTISHQKKLWAIGEKADSVSGAENVSYH